MESPSDDAVTVPLKERRHASALSILIEDLHQFAFDDDSVPESFSKVVEELEGLSREIQEIRLNKKIVVEKLFKQYSDCDDASKILVENAKLFEELQELLLSETKPLTSDEDREAFVCEKLWLEEAIEKYRNEITILETTGAADMEEMKSKNSSDRTRLKERKRSLEAEIRDHMVDLERQKTELKGKHERTLEELLTKFRARLSEIEESRSHRNCESELASWRSSWNETLQGSEVAIGRTQNEIPEVRAKKRRTSPRERASREHKSGGAKLDPRNSGAGDCLIPADCAVVIEAMDEVPDSSDDLSTPKTTSVDLHPSKATSVSASSGRAARNELSSAQAGGDGLGPRASTPEGPQDVAVVPENSTQSSSLKPAGKAAARRRLFDEQPVEGTFGIITDTTPQTIEEYLRSLQRMVSENSKRCKQLKRKKA